MRAPTDHLTGPPSSFSIGDSAPASQRGNDKFVAARDARELGIAQVTASVNIPIRKGITPKLSVFSGLIDGCTDHFALTFAGKREGPPMLRVHSSCMTGDIFGSMRCDCGPQLHDAIKRLSVDGGHLLYLPQEGRGIGLAAKIAAYELQDRGFDTFEANRRAGFPDDLRDYRVAAQMLLALGTRQVRLLTNNPDKVTQLKRSGIDVVSIEPTVVSENSHNHRYLAAKRDLARHSLKLRSSFPLNNSGTTVGGQE